MLNIQLKLVMKSLWGGMFLTVAAKSYWKDLDVTNSNTTNTSE